MLSSINTSLSRIVLSATLALISALPLMASQGESNLNRARELSRSTSGIVNNVKERISSVNPDSVSSMVVMTLPNASDSVVEEAAVDTDSLDDEDASTIVNINGISDMPESVNSFWDKTLLIPIFGIVFGITVPFAAFVLVIYFICRSFSQRKRMKYDTILKAAQMGHPLPPEFYLTEAPRPKNKLQSGIVWCGWGVACIILGIWNEGAGWTAIGMIPLFIGLSRIAVYLIDRNKKTDSNISDSLPGRDAQQD